MEYFDSDVLIHAFVNQDDIRHQTATTLIYQALDTGRFMISALTVQEVSFVLARLGLSQSYIRTNIDFLLNQNPVSVDALHLRRATDLADALGYRHINDCIHTAVAEGYDCGNFVTYNASEYTRIQRISNLRYTILR